MRRKWTKEDVEAALTALYAAKGIVAVFECYPPFWEPREPPQEDRAGAIARMEAAGLRWYYISQEYLRERYFSDSMRPVRKVPALVFG